MLSLLKNAWLHSHTLGNFKLLVVNGRKAFFLIFKLIGEGQRYELYAIFCLIFYRLCDVKKFEGLYHKDRQFISKIFLRFLLFSFPIPFLVAHCCVEKWWRSRKEKPNIFETVTYYMMTTAVYSTLDYALCYKWKIKNLTLQRTFSTFFFFHYFLSVCTKSSIW